MPRTLALLLLAWGLLPMLASISAVEAAESLRCFVGTYTRGASQGVYTFTFDPTTGRAGPVRLAASAENPSFLALHPEQPWLYAVNEVGEFNGQKSGAVSAFAMDRRTGELRLLNQQPSRGGAPCHLVVDAAGRNVLVANYTGGNVAALPIDAEGRLQPASGFAQHSGSSIHPRRQQEPHAHSINLSPDNRFAFAADLGVDKIFAYRFDPGRGTLTPHTPAAAPVEPGSGPRHFDFHPNGRFAYVINELSLTVTAFAYDADRGRLKRVQTIATVPDNADRQGLSTAEVRVHPSGRFLYGSNRGHHSIVVYRIDPDKGTLTLVEHEPTGGRTPRNFYIAPGGDYLFAENQSSGTIVVFRIDGRSGKLDATGEVVEVPSPVCLRAIPAEP